MIAYKTNDGHLREFDDFFVYVMWLIQDKKSRDEDWEMVLTKEFWGDQLIDIEILDKIKNDAKGKS